MDQSEILRIMSVDRPLAASGSTELARAQIARSKANEVVAEMRRDFVRKLDQFRKSASDRLGLDLAGSEPADGIRANSTLSSVATTARTFQPHRIDPEPEVLHVGSDGERSQLPNGEARPWLSELDRRRAAQSELPPSITKNANGRLQCRFCGVEFPEYSSGKRALARAREHAGLCERYGVDTEKRTRENAAATGTHVSPAVAVSWAGRR